ncbi:MAG: 2Fe-2S iron-sulfur cluster binding domain-containing protein [Candidatus Aminicenantes bacterium]|nr:2Fe-2S iron-sulfur cluster binding domain-containing protein [Candidatus Aminicenantes bacterium]
MIKIIIDDKTVEAKEGTTVLSAAKLAGIQIPHLCYHAAFIPEGSCRMCLVEIEGFPKLELACSTQVKEDLRVWTQSKKVTEARKGVLEFILAEHPLDCPICDKAGECKLQDYYEEYGLFESQFKELKEKREKKVSIGERLILDRERCILCTRCVRFLREVTKTQELGVFNRGVRSEISTYDGELVDNNYSGNLTEVCPVGAITDTDFRFQIRSWFLQKGDSICPLCSRGCNISIEYHPGFARIPRKKRVYRITSRENLAVNDFWICDLGRYAYSYLDENRLSNFLSSLNGKNKRFDQESALQFAAQKIKKLYDKKKISRMTLILNSWLTNEELFLVRKIFRDDLRMQRIFMVDPSQGEKDKMLLTSERSPNRKGAEEIGFDFQSLDFKGLAGKTDVLVMFGEYLLDLASLEEIKAVLEGIETSILFSSKESALVSLFGLVFPTALAAEKSGSFTNCEGKIQSFEPVLESWGESRPEWQFLLELSRELDINSNYYNQIESTTAVLEKMREEISFFQKEK